MGKILKSKAIVLLAVLSISSLSFLFLTSQDWFREASLFYPLRSTLSRVEAWLSAPRSFISGIIQDTEALLITFDENKLLKSEINRLSGIVDENNSLKLENESLRSSLELESIYGQSSPIVAEVVHRSPSSWSQSLLISRGESSGISKGNLVLANGGVVGLVSEVFADTATVQLLQDNTFKANLAVKIGDHEPAYGILKSFDPMEGKFLISQVTEKERIHVKARVVTSDLSADYPESLLLGEVIEVKQNKDSLEVEVYVNPSANFSDIYSVVVIGYQK